MRIYLYVLVLSIICPMALSSQITGLSGWDICLDPGHSQTENMGIYGYSEAEKNVRVALRLREILLNETDIDTVYMTRTNDQQVVSLSQRTNYANGISATWFHSIHSDAGGSGSNSTLLLWGQYNTGLEKVPNGGKAMSDIMIEHLTDGMRTYTVYGSIGDYSFYGRCPSYRPCPYLYVNYYTSMPSELSEAGFHTNPTQNQLNMNDDWKRLEARTFYWSILDFHGIERPLVRIVTGIVTNVDNGFPINGAEIIVNDSLYVTDTYESLFYKYSTNPELLRNGFYYFEGVEGDTVDIIAYAEGYDRDTIRVALVDDFFTFQDIGLVSNVLPYVKSTFPADGDTSFSVLDVIGIEFSRPMNQASVETTLVIVPDIEAELSWREDDSRLVIVSDSLKFLTQYTITVSGKSVDKFDHPFDGNKDGIGGDDFTFSFRTGIDTEPPALENTYPSYNKRGVELKPIVSVTYNEELDPTTVTQGIFKLERVADKSYVDLDLAHYVVNRQSVVNLFPHESLFDNERYITQISAGLKDLLGNTVASSLSYPFNTGIEDIEITLIDNFESGVNNWWDPTTSGSTIGEGPATSRAANNEITNLLSASNTSLELNYEWLLGEDAWLIREFLDYDAPPKNIRFYTNNTIQCYVFGDGSGNKFRFSISEVNGSGYPLEVSKWVDIDWLGWKLVEWDLSDPNSVGSWLGNEILDGTSYYFDSLQLTHAEEAEVIGTIYFDDLQIVEKFNVSKVEDNTPYLPEKFLLSQNYPNPFNPITHIKFSLTETNLTTLTIYDVIGRKVKTLVNERLAPGVYEVVFDAGSLASGTYFYILNSGSHTMKKKMILLK